METLIKNLTIAEIIEAENEDLYPIIPPEPDIISECKRRKRGFATLGSTLEPRSYPGIVKNN